MFELPHYADVRVLFCVSRSIRICPYDLLVTLLYQQLIQVYRNYCLLSSPRTGDGNAADCRRSPARRLPDVMVSIKNVRNGSRDVGARF